MTIYELNRWKELNCVLFGHDFNERYAQSELTGEVLVEHHTCGNCGLTVKDESGLLEKYKRGAK